MRTPALFALLVLVAFCLVPFMAVGSGGGPVSGHSGDPVFNNTCATSPCHTGSPLNIPGVKLVIETPTASSGSRGTYPAGSAMPIRVTLKGSNQSKRNGFQISSWKQNPQSIFDLLSGLRLQDAATTRYAGSTAHVTHTSGGNLQDEWRVYFMTPATPTSLTFYCAGNDANDNATNSGDHIYTTKLDVDVGSIPLSLKQLPTLGSTVALQLDAPGDPGKAYVLGVSLGNSGIPVGSQVVPLALDTFLLLSINGVMPFYAGTVGFLDGNGQATCTINIPTLPIGGITLYHAFVVIDPGAPGGIGTISNGLPVTFI